MRLITDLISTFVGAACAVMILTFRPSLLTLLLVLAVFGSVS